MASISQFQNVFRVSKTGSNGAQTQPIRRNRQAVSCIQCRSRKLKCDRQDPCSSCTKRGDPTSCQYSGSIANARNGRDDGNKASEAQLRLQKLEQMVTDLIQSNKGISTAPNGIDSQPSAAIDQRLQSLSVDTEETSCERLSGGHLDSESKYVGATHWATILENIRDIQGVLQPDNNRDEDDVLDAAPMEFDPVVDTSQPLNLMDVYDFMPQRKAVDKMLQIAFTARHVQVPFIHQGQFLRQYESFWKTPASTPLLWLSILLSLLHIGARMDQMGAQELHVFPDAPTSAALFVKAGQCLVAGKYRRAKKYSVEALLMYAICKHMLKEDPESDSWTLMGVAARLSMKMGYHRDPSHLAKINPFDGEMRRRAFLVIKNFDLLLSSQAGLPPILHEDECDTAGPANLFDSDFDENCKELPLSRPDTDLTPLLYYIVKNRFATVYRRIIRHALSSVAPPYDKTLELDREMREVYDKIPSGLRTIPVGSSFADESYVVMQRLNIALLYNKSLCVLHRHYISHDRLNPRFEPSRKRCIESALRILEYQDEIRQACAPGGQFYTNKWMLGSLTLHDFLLAAMITALDMYEAHKLGVTSQDEIQLQKTKYDALTNSHEIWTMRRPYSLDARRASDVIAIMLSKVPRPLNSASIQDTSPSTSSNSTQDFNGTSEAYTSSNGSGELWHANNLGIPMADYTNFEHLALTSEDPLDSMFCQPDSIDWTALDQNILEGAWFDNTGPDTQLIDEVNWNYPPQH